LGVHRAEQSIEIDAPPEACLLEPLDGGARTRATYRLGIDPGVPLPGLVARRLTSGVMGRSVRDLRDEVERRARS
jgi:hypothetical protein